ncbi:PLP-dependent aminotransferase family protein [Candidatus Bipolaricaulota bacterium]|nr:PLP-dependent aminotransferase family protein [Candidatus Bipolaricaulota bacterium]
MALSRQAQIVRDFRDRIAQGELQAGERLPTTRALAAELGVGRSTIVRAYESLAREGWIEGEVGRGTHVRGVPSEPFSTLNWDAILASSASMPDREYGDLFQLISRPDCISLAGGLPATEFFPIELYQDIVAQVLRDNGSQILQWCPVDGYPPLRSLLAETIGSSTDNVLVTAGSTQGIHLVAQAMVNPGDLVLVEAPTYPGALKAFSQAGARVIGVPTSHVGIDLDVLEDLLNTTRPKFIYVVPTHQNPSGGTLPIDKRHRLLSLAAAHRIPIVEDDAYRSIWFDTEPPPTLYELDDHELVIYVSTFSKVLFPGLRVGWIAVPQPVVKRLGALRNLFDLFVNGPAQASLYAFHRKGLLDRHLRSVRPKYAERCRQMVADLQRFCPDLEYVVPRGGFFIWAQLPDGIDSRDLLRHAVSCGVSFLHGGLFQPDQGGEHSIRLTFAAQSEESIHAAVRRLRIAIDRCHAASPSTRSRDGHSMQFVV